MSSFEKCLAKTAKKICIAAVHCVEKQEILQKLCEINDRSHTRASYCTILTEKWISRQINIYQRNYQKS